MILCALARKGSPAFPLSTIHKCELCRRDVMTAPTSRPLIVQGAHILCTACGEALAELQGGVEEYQPVPGSLNEVADLLGPDAAFETADIVAALNEGLRRRRTS